MPPIFTGFRAVPHPGVSSEQPVVPLARSGTHPMLTAFATVYPSQYGTAALAATRVTLASRENLVSVKRVGFCLMQAGRD